MDLDELRNKMDANADRRKEIRAMKFGLTQEATGLLGTSSQAPAKTPARTALMEVGPPISLPKEPDEVRVTLPK